VKRLRKLLTGKDEDPRPRLSSTGPVAAIASELMPFFPPDPDGTTHFRMFSFGGERARSEKIGTFNVPESIRQSRGKSCPTCRSDIDSQTQTHGWVGIPQHRSALGNALVVFYFDLEENRIPARYDALLPMPSADIAARLSKGEGLVAVKERAGAPPVILIAAPRFALLDDVESELAKMNKLPTAPMAITLPGSLEAEEIQDVVRASFGSFRGCYEARLAQDPAAEGRIMLDFQIDPDGHVSNMKAVAESASIASMEACMADAAKNFVFPAAAQSTTVKYPIMFSPGD
jgi:TonB family protein